MAETFEEIVATYWKVTEIDEDAMPRGSKSLLISLGNNSKRLSVFSELATRVELGDYVQLDESGVPRSLFKPNR
jgi:hypothetical protein